MKGAIKPEIKKKAIHRLKIMEGAVRGLQKMVDDEKYCIDIMTQTAAIQESLKSFDALMLENHIRSHIVDMVKNGKVDKAVVELKTLYQYKRR
jgi:CsoR family transcriptional regulator, copper-sensing transcriptional repressor